MNEPDQEFDSASSETLEYVLEEIGDQLRAGQPIDLDQYIERHPEYAEQLRNFVNSMKILASVGECATGDSASPEHHADEFLQNSRTLGDFRILDELGRGGMGVVYEAEQISLDRRVALKILPFASLLDERQLRRFRNEARAAATLHHTNIVPVFAVGNERGVHYYAMQRIDGASLAEVIRDLREAESADGNSNVALSRGTAIPSIAPIGIPTETRRHLQASLSTERTRRKGDYFRMVARWGMQAADALAFAHENGVLHRDIKPGNLMLDRSGKIWIADFGLARFESDASMTMTGDVVGTLRYMAPEQALGKRVIVDHRADIYSLAATLYELVTLQPAFCGDDRQQLLHDIAFVDPKPPRSVDNNIPVDLETIIMKAFSKAPEDRYDSAQKLVDDLTQFVANRPIVAKPPSVWDRIRKWTRRHPAVARSTAIALILISVVSIAGLTWSRQINQQLKNAVQRADRKANEANAALSRESAALSSAKSANDKSLLALKASKQSELQASQNLYLATMSRAFRDLLRGDSTRIAESLVQFAPSADDVDLRKWEWYYLSGLYHQEATVLREHADLVIDVAWKPDGKYLATCSFDGTVRLWDPSSKELKATIGHVVSPSTCAWHPTADLLAIATDDGQIRIWNTKSALVHSEIVTDKSGFRSLSFSKDGRKLAASHRRGWSIWNVESQSEVWSKEPESRSYASDISWSVDDRMVACCAMADNSSVRVYDIDQDRLVFRIEDGLGDSLKAKWSPQGDVIAVGDYHNALHVFDARNGALLRSLETPGAASQLTWSPTGDLIAVGVNRAVRVYDVNWNHVSTLRGHSSNVTSIAWSTNAKSLAACAADGTTRVWHVASTNNVADRRDKYGIHQVSDGFNGHFIGQHPFSSSRRLVATVDLKLERLVVRQTSDGAIVQSFSVPVVEDTVRYSFSEDEGQIAVADRDGNIVVCNIGSGKQRVMGNVGPGRTRSINWSAVNQKLAIAIDVPGESNGRVDIWNTGTGKHVASIELPIAGGSASWNPTGKRLATTDGTGVVKVWDATDGQLLLQLVGHRPNKWIHLPRWNGDGKLLATNGWDRVIRIWNIDTGKSISEFHGHESFVQQTTWSPDESRIVSTSGDGTVRLWDVESGQEVFTLEVDYRAAAFAPDGTRLYLLGDTLDVVDVAPLRGSYRNELRHQLGTVLVYREQIDRAQSICETMDHRSSAKFGLMQQLFHAGVDRVQGNVASGLELSVDIDKLLERWQLIVNEPDPRPIAEYGIRSSERLTRLLINAASSAVDRSRAQINNNRQILASARRVVQAVERFLPESNLPTVNCQALATQVSELKRGIDTAAHPPAEPTH